MAADLSFNSSAPLSCVRPNLDTVEVHPSFHVSWYLPGGWVLVHHTGVLKHVGPLAARPCVAVLEMLSEVVRTVKLLG